MNRLREEREIDLLKLAAALWHRAWAIVLAMLVCGGAAFGYARFFIPPLYRSSVYLYVNNNTFSLGNTSISMADLSASKSLVDTYIVILKTRTTLNDVIDRAGLDYTYNQLYDMISASSVDNTEIFRVTVEGSDPEEATLIANTIAEILPDKISDILDGSSVRTVDLAVVPERKSSPNVTRITSMGLLVGLVLSAGTIILLEQMDEQIRDEEFLTEAFGLSVLAVVPDLFNTKENKGNYSSYHDPLKGKK